MRIRKSYTLPNAHIVRNCSSLRCKKSLHGHVYEVEVFFESDALDNGMMVLDFGLTKGTIKDFIWMFKNSYSMWEKESDSFKEGIKKSTKRWVQMPVSPSAEAYSYLFMYAIDKIIKNTVFANGEQNVRVSSVKVHETRTGYAESFQKDLTNPKMPQFTLEDIVFSEEVIKSCKDPNMLKNLLEGVKFINDKVEQQV